ncbi:MAG: DUF1559 domain-containing protein, partial [Blastopirellula sp. JB062]
SEVTDGTSNTLILAEQSAPTLSSTGVASDMRSSGDYGSFQGANTRDDIKEGSDWDTVLQYHRAFNVVTVRYQINSLTSPGMSTTAGGPNNNVNSSHPGGAQFARVDGSVAFIPETISFDTLRNLCTRDDGEVLGEY